MHTSVPEVVVKAPRVTLDEILDRVARGEARRESLLTDVAFTATFRVLRLNKDEGPHLVAETVTRVLRKPPYRSRAIVLRQWKERDKDKDKKKVTVDVQYDDDMSEEIVNFAFRPEARREFKYHIAGRDIVGNHVIYRLAFEPRSRLDPSMPSGLVWVDTNEFVIVRQEVAFDRSPAPLFFRGVDRMVIERQHVGDHWMLWRVLMRGGLTFSVPKFGKNFDVSILFDQYAINGGIPDSLFTGGKRAPNRVNVWN